jgi:hypothetical protein
MTPMTVPRALPSMFSPRSPPSLRGADIERLADRAVAIQEEGDEQHQGQLQQAIGQQCRRAPAPVAGRGDQLLDGRVEFLAVAGDRRCQLASISRPTRGRPLSQPGGSAGRPCFDIGFDEIDQLVRPVGQRAGEKQGGHQHDQDQRQGHQRSPQVIAPADPRQQLVGVETPGADPQTTNANSSAPTNGSSTVTQPMMSSTTSAICASRLGS